MPTPSPPDTMAGDTSTRVDVSVVFATRDRAEQLTQTLAAYDALNTGGLHWELIVVDNNSDDATAAVLNEAAHRLPLKTLFVSEGGQNRARNAALDQLRGDLVVFTDDDVIPDPDCLQAYAAAAARWPDDVIFGARIKPRFPSNTPDWMRGEDFSFATTAFARYNPTADEGRVRRHPYGPSFAVRRHALRGRSFPEHLGPQSNSYAMGGEGYFLLEIAAEGYGYVYVPAARVEHVVREEQVTERWLLNRARNKGRGQIYLPSGKKPRRVFIGGVPLRLYLATLRAGLRYALARLGGNARHRLNRGIRYELRRGQVEELRARGRHRNKPESRRPTT